MTDFACMKVKRSKYVAYFTGEGLIPDLSGLLSGKIGMKLERKVIAASAIAEAETLLSIDEFNELFCISTYSWTEVSSLDELSEERFTRWAKAGLLLTDIQDGWARAYCQREETLDRDLWHCRSAIFHFLAKWKGVALFADAGEKEDPYLFAVRQLAGNIDAWQKFAPPPDPFWSHPNVLTSLPLPPPCMDGAGEFLQTLTSRCSTRHFDHEACLPLDRLSSILYYAFAPQGIAQSVYTAVHKTSPSGGGLHPTEAYLLVRKVDGLQPGLYHYNSARHRLDKLKDLTEAEASKKALKYAAGQPYVRSCAAAIILSTRFYRNHWKYRRNERTYLVLAMDIGHLGQTLYLLSTYFKLGGFFTAAVNASDIEHDLGIDGAQQGVMAMFVIGIRHSEARPEFAPYEGEV